MGSSSGFSADGDLGEVQFPTDRYGNASGSLSIAQRQANILTNLGVNAGTASNPGGGTSANGTLITKGVSAANTLMIVNSSGNFTFGGTFTVSGTLTVSGAQVLTANLELAAGTTTLAPLTFQAGTNLTTATAGVMEFDGTAFYATAAASSRQQLDAEQYIIASANSTTYSNTGLDSSSAYQAFTATTNPALTAGAVTLVAGKTYYFEAVYMLTNTGTTSHTWATALGGTATFSAGSGYQAFGASGVTASTPISGSLTGFINSTTLSTAVVCTAASTSATEQVTITQSGILVVLAAGTVIPQLKASARPGATGTAGVTLLAGSFFRIWEMGTNTQVGNWS